MSPTNASENEDTDILTPAQDSAEDRREDEEDLQCAREGLPAKEGSSQWWKHLGPGLITGAADDDPSGIGTYSVTGAQFGYGLLWLVPFCLPLMIAVQEMCGRVGLITGKGLAAVIKQHYPRWLLYGSVLLLVGANVVNIYADLNVMAASAKMLFHGPFVLWLVVMTLAIALAQIFIPYHHYVKVLKWLCLALGAYVVVALLPSVHNDWAAIARHSVVPSWTMKPAFLLTVVGFLGTTISPYLFFWQAGEEVEEEIAEGKADRPGHRTERVSDDEVRNLRADTMIGMFASQAVCFFIIICTAATLHAHGKIDINTAQDAAEALRPLGSAAYWLFTLGMLGTGLLAIPTLAGSAAYAVSETFGWRYGLYRRLRRARGFYLTVGATTVIGALLNFVHALDPVKALLYSAVLNGIVAVPLLVVLMLVCNNAKIVKERVNGPLSNLVGWLTVALMAGAAGIMIWALATGKA
ncbi:MAG TPA: divalent metal cation transporter [Chthonomonadaceae bacterium]|nr:divalent metal cation transporter [Chthonomonadaceae bacterium]